MPSAEGSKYKLLWFASSADFLFSRFIFCYQKRCFYKGRDFEELGECGTELGIPDLVKFCNIPDYYLFNMWNEDWLRDCQYPADELFNCLGNCDSWVVDASVLNPVKNGPVISAEAFRKRKGLLPRRAEQYAHPNPQLFAVELWSGGRQFHNTF